MIRLYPLTILVTKRFIQCRPNLLAKSNVTKLTVELHKRDNLSDNLHLSNYSGSSIGDKNEETSIIEKKATEILSPSLRYVRNLIDEHEGNVVLTQIGSFYELYFEQAVKYAPILNISLTNRTYAHGKVPFAGFPVPQLGRHLKILVNDFGYNVVIAEQFKKNDVAENEQYKFIRRVTRIVTPGTFIDEAFENFQENSYLLSIEFPENCMKRIALGDLKLGLSWCDVSTGEVFVQQMFLKDLISSITRIRPKEIILNEDLYKNNIVSGEWYPELVALKKYFLNYQRMPSQHRTIESFYDLFTSGNTDSVIRQLKLQFQTFTQKELAALRNILIYISDHLPNISTNLQIPQREITTSIMQIDSRTSSALELHSTVRNNSKKGTLLSSIRRTITPSGTRLLTQWLSGPSLDLKEIRNRQKLVSYFMENPDIMEHIIQILKDTCDITRVLQKFSFRRGEIIELIQLAKTLQHANTIREYLTEQLSLKKVNSAVKTLLQDHLKTLAFEESAIDKILLYLNEDELLKGQTEINNEDVGVETQSKNQGSPETLGVYIIDPMFSPKLASKATL